ncbi:uncharacterized protein LOC142318133 [Lycorma delicatula]|uniref:uncharacterized protein LOC142318133 n=1 Tax=Lycorma delicatula TaxID=130591 RepID=UPI003F5131BF
MNSFIISWFLIFVVFSIAGSVKYINTEDLNSKNNSIFKDSDGQNVRKKRHFQCPKDGFHEDPESCTSFYRCVYNMPHHFDCGPGTVYEPSLNVCGHANTASRVECRSGTSTPKKNKPSNDGFYYQNPSNRGDIYNQYIYYTMHYPE